MSSIEIRVGTEHHLTLIHFESMDLAKMEQVFSVLTDIMGMVKNPPQGVFTHEAKMGRYRNVRARMVESQYLVMLQGEIARRLDEQHIYYSNDFDFNPHVTKPLDSFTEGSEVPFADYMEFKWKGGQQLAYFELGVHHETRPTPTTMGENVQVFTS